MLFIAAAAAAASAPARRDFTELVPRRVDELKYSQIREHEQPQLSVLIFTYFIDYFWSTEGSQSMINKLMSKNTQNGNIANGLTRIDTTEKRIIIVEILILTVLANIVINYSDAQHNRFITLTFYARPSENTMTFHFSQFSL